MGILEDLKLNKGQPPMNPGQFQRRVLAYNENIWPKALREQYTDAYELWKDQMRPVLAEAEANYAFNHKLKAYRDAVERLSRYRLSEGRDELTEEVETGEFDENGNPVIEMVVTQTAKAPLPATVEVTEYDEEGNEVTSTVPNPAITQDEAERAQEQAVIDSTPQDVVGFNP